MTLGDDRGSPFMRRAVAFAVDSVLLSPLLLASYSDEVAVRAAGVVTAHAYFVGFNWLGMGRTLGKRSLGLTVLGATTGKPLSLGQAAVRQSPYVILGLISAVVPRFSDVSLWPLVAATCLVTAVDVVIAIRRPGSSLHDRLAGSRVFTQQTFGGQP